MLREIFLDKSKFKVNFIKYYIYIFIQFIAYLNKGMLSHSDSYKDPLIKEIFLGSFNVESAEVD